MNTYKKYCPNVFVAECEEKHNEGDVILVTTKRGKENEHYIHNFIGYTGTKEEPKYCYSITRVDGYNAREHAKKKVKKLEGYAEKADKRSDEAYSSRATKSELDFMSLAEPIKVGHHSEKRHRRLFERYDNKMRKSVEESDKAEEYRSRKSYWEQRTDVINLSMPESIDYYEYKLHEAKQQYKFYKDNPDKREHSYSLTYANKEVKEQTKNVERAIRLWGTKEEIEFLKQEKANK